MFNVGRLAVIAHRPLILLTMSISVGAGTAIAGALTAAGSTANNIIQGRMSKKQRQWNEQMMDKQNAWSVNMYNKYSSPSAQRQQMLDAGINPLANDMTGGSMPTSASANDYQLPSFENPIEKGMQAYLQYKMNQSQVTNIDADTEQKYAETARLLQITPHEVASIEKNNLILEQNLENLKSSKNLTDEQAKNLQIINEWLPVEKDFELHKKISEIAVNESVSALNEENAKKVQYELENLLPLQKLNAKLSNDQLEQLIEETKQKIELLKKQTGLAEKDIINYGYNHLPNAVKAYGSAMDLVDKTGKQLKSKIKNFGENVGMFFMNRLSQAYDLSW